MHAVRHNALINAIIIICMHYALAYIAVSQDISASVLEAHLLLYVWYSLQKMCPSPVLLYIAIHAAPREFYVGSDIHNCEPHALTGIHLEDTGAQLHWLGCSDIV